MRSGAGAEIEDVDGRRYVDWVMSWGPLIFGHADPGDAAAAVVEAAGRGTSFGAPTEAEVELAAEIVDAVPSVEMVRLVSSGTEAAMSARSGSRAAATQPRPDRQVRRLLPRPRRRAARERRAPGSRRSAFPARPACRPARPPTRSSARTTTSTRSAAAVARWGEGLACIVVEPVAGNMGVVPPAARLPRGAARALRRLRRAARLRRGDHRLPRRPRRRAGALRRHARPDHPRARSSAAGCRSRRSAGARDVMEQLAPAGARLPGGHALGEPAGDRGRALGAAAAARRGRVRAAGDGRRSGSRRGSSPFGRVQRVGAMLTLFMSDGPGDAVRARRRRATPSATARSSATCSRKACTSRRPSSRRCSSRPPTATRRSKGRWRRLPASSVERLGA